MDHRMLRRVLPLLVIAITVGLTAAAIQFLPETLYFPVAELSSPTGRQVTILDAGRTERVACERVLVELAKTFSAACGDCTAPSDVFTGCPLTGAGLSRMNESRNPQPAGSRARPPSCFQLRIRGWPWMRAGKPSGSRLRTRRNRGCDASQQVRRGEGCVLKCQARGA
jgi:hypothetical protein